MLGCHGRALNIGNWFPHGYGGWKSGAEALVELCSLSRPRRNSVFLFGFSVSSNLGISWLMALPVLILTLIHLVPFLPVSLNSLLLRTPIILINTHPSALYHPVAPEKTSLILINTHPAALYHRVEPMKTSFPSRK